MNRIQYRMTDYGVVWDVVSNLKGIMGFRPEFPKSNTMKDLFETPELLPTKVQEIINKFNHDNEPYLELERMKGKLEPLGYTFEYGLDGVGYGLRLLSDF